MKLKIFQVDAFTKDLFAGNPAAVVPLDAWLPDDVMQRIAAENNLAETAFFVRNGDTYEIKWFTPTVEIALCGHATLASAYVVFRIVGHDSDKIQFHSHISGDLFVERKDDLFVLDFPSYPPSKFELPGLGEILGREPLEITEAGGYVVALFATEADVAAITPDFRAMNDLDAHAVVVTAKGSSSDFVSRFFGPAVGVDEDPVTGSSHCRLIPYWAAKLGKTKLFARQISKRGGEIYCELIDDRVKMGGNAALYMKGEIYVDATGEKSVAA
ncbi:MAG: PhzF family phenazine biosynthesis protein [Pyrinomonadaceae bacterium]